MYQRPQRPDELYHYGVKGMHWGIRRYQNYDGTLKHPKGARNDGGSTTKVQVGLTGITVTKTQTVSESSKQEEKKGLTSGQKKAIIAGVAIVGAGLATYRLYKTGKLDDLTKSIGSEQVNNVIQFNPKEKIKPVDSTKQSIKDDILKSKDWMNENKGQGPFAAGNAILATEFTSKAPSHVKRLLKPETREQARKNANVLTGEDRKNTCTPTAFAEYLRTQGIDAKVTERKKVEGQILGGMAEDILKFKDESERRKHIKDGYATTFGKSDADAEKVLKRYFGDNAVGACAIQWKGLDVGHTFSFETKSGITSFSDGHAGAGDKDIRQRYFNSGRINTNDSMTLVNFKGITPEMINWEALEKYGISTR